MGALINFVNWFWRLLSKSVGLLFNLPFQIGLAIGGCVAAVATMFSHFSFFSSATSCINELTRSAQTVTLSPPQSFVIFTLYTLSPTVAVLGT